MKFVHTLAACAALALIPNSATNAARTSDKCAAVQAIKSGSLRDFSGLSIGMDDDGLLHVSHNRRDSIITGASDCSLNTPTDYFELNCSWDYAQDFDQARAKINLLRVQLSKCLGTPLESYDRTVHSEGIAYPQAYRTSFLRPNDEELSVDLILYEFTTDQKPSRYNVDLTFSI